MSEKLLSVRVPAELLDRVDAACGAGGRSKWVRDALERSLSGPAPVVRNERRRPAVKSARPAVDADGEAVLGLLASRPRMVRRLHEELGWMPLRVERVLGRLGDRVRFRDGLVEAVDASEG